MDKKKRRSRSKREDGGPHRRGPPSYRVQGDDGLDSTLLAPRMEKASRQTVMASKTLHPAFLARRVEILSACSSLHK